jgi:hypothetical protein
VSTPDGALVWGTSYGGAKTDSIEIVAPGSLGDVYVGGWTRSSDGIASPGAHDVALAKDDDIDELSDNDDAFLVRLAGDGTRMWGTYYGDLGFDAIVGLAPQPGGGVIVAGATSSKTAIATPDAFQPEFASGAGYLLDAFLARLDAEGSRAWGTYFGGKGTDQGDALATNGSGAVYLLGIVASPGLATPDAFAGAPPGTSERSCPASRPTARARGRPTRAGERRDRGRRIPRPLHPGRRRLVCRSRRLPRWRLRRRRVLRPPLRRRLRRLQRRPRRDRPWHVHAARRRCRVSTRERGV